jgi:hypothetical protein
VSTCLCWRYAILSSTSRAFGELGAHLDRIFRHLSHKTGGLKFTCIAGGRDPSSGEVVVLESV